MDHLTIQSDEVALQAIKEITRPRYEKLWKDFKQYTGQESLNNRVPSEDEILAFMRHLRDDKGIKSSTMWTSYSQLKIRIQPEEIHLCYYAPEIHGY